MRALAAQHLLPAERHHIQLVPRQVHRECRAGRVADRQARAVGGDRVAVRHPHARGRAVPGEDHVAVEIDLGQIHDLPIVGRADGRVQLQLLDRVRDPALAEAFPGEHFNRARAQHGPHRHLDRAGVRTRHDADAVVGGHAQHLARQVDRLRQLGLADGMAMRAAERRACKHVQRKMGDLGARARGKTRIDRPRCRSRRIEHG